MPIDPNEANRQAPSAATVKALTERLMSLDPALERDVAAFRATHLARIGAIGLDGNGEVNIKPAHVDTIRQVAPELLSLPRREPTKIDALSPEGRALQRERLYRERLDDSKARREGEAARQSKLRESMRAIEKRMLDAVTEDPSLAKSPARRASLRAGWTLEAFTAAGLPVPAGLTASGV